MNRKMAMKRAYFAELLATFFLVFAGTGAVVINEVSGGAIGHLGVALSFGLVVGAMIVVFGDVSGAHMNPAVSVGLVFAGKMPWVRLPGYLAAQLLGAVLASALLRQMFPTATTLGQTQPQGALWVSWWLELILTAVLMLAVLRVKENNAALTIGAVIALEALVAGPICGASMNPARSLGPAWVSGELQHLWIYLTAPFAGVGVALSLQKFFAAPNATISDSAPESP